MQLELHKNLKRFNVIVTHRRAGKTVFLVNQIIKTLVQCDKKEARGYYIAPFFSQARQICWDFAKFYGSKIPGIKINESELKIDFPNGARMKLLGADNYNALRGIRADIVALDEYADIDPAVLPEVILPALSDRQGILIVTGTPKGHNHFYDLYKKALTDKQYYTAMFKASQTGILSSEELERYRLAVSEEVYNQEMECDFAAANQGSYYAKQLVEARQDGRVCELPYDDRKPVYTFWDLGVSDTTCIWFLQKISENRIHVIDYYENSGESLAHYINILANKPYTYDINYGHWAPHDIEVREFASGGQQTVKTRKEIARQLGVKFNVVDNIPVADGIEAVRRFLNKCWFDTAKCERGLKALENYSRTWDNKNSIWKDKPLHNWASNGSDAFRYAAVGIDGCKTFKEIEQLFKPFTDDQLKGFYYG